MDLKFKTIILSVPFLFFISCSDSNQEQNSNETPESSKVEESNVAWDATNYTLYNEFMQCEAGENYSQEALDDMIKSWRDLGLSDSLLGGWGYVSVSPESSSFNNYWELSWSSKEEADAAWKEWILNEDAMVWREKSSSILQCDGENRDGYDFIFPYDPYAFGEAPEDGSFAASFSACTLNEGMDQENLTSALIAYNSWLDGINSSDVNGFYAYGLYIPNDDSATEDFWFGNFHENLETMNEGNALWEASGGDAKALLESVSTCGEPEVSNGQVFFDPAKPDFS